MVKRVVGKKEKVAKAVDKCIRSVGKRVNACRSPHRAFAHVALQSLRWASILRGLRFYQAQRCASYHLLIAPIRRWLGKGKEAVFNPCLNQNYRFVESLRGCK
jgi:hypothetical protein